MSAGVTAIILARAGSKGVPGKNHAPIAGRPCVLWTIDHANASRSVSETVISTDDPCVKEVAVAAGVRVIDRPAALASDDAPVDGALRHALGVLKSEGGRERAVIVMLYANVPVRPKDLTDRAVDLLTGSGADSVQSVCDAGKHHPWWTLRLDDAGRMRPWDGDELFHGVFRRQMLPPAFIPDGGVTALTAAALDGIRDGAAGPHAFLGRDRRAIVTLPGDVVDIDSRLDAIVADAMLSHRHSR